MGCLSNFLGGPGQLLLTANVMFREGLKKVKLGFLAEVSVGRYLRGGSRAKPCYQVFLLLENEPNALKNKIQQ